MSHILSLGAINKITDEYVYPKIANKKDEYICPECNKDLILCQGKIKVHHFRHKVDNVNPCHHYSYPTEAQIHKDAKILLKNILERKIPISFIRNCCSCKKNEEFEIPEISETSTIQLEYRFEYNGVKIADVAYIDNGVIVCIFEICNTHKTCSDNRPEPWFEIYAETLIKMANDNSLTLLQIPCIRREKCVDCIEKEKQSIIKKNEALDILYHWFQPGIEIFPFIYDYSSFAGVEKNVTCDLNYNVESQNELFDLILYVNGENSRFERYCIRLIYKNSKYYFKNEKEYAEFIIGVYYIDIDWILSQTEIPNKINYIASLDCYDRKEHEFKCKKCFTLEKFWVIREDNINYKVTHIGCPNCGHNTNVEFIECERCNSYDTPLCVMETNVVSQNICKNCDIYLYFCENIYLNVPFRSKDEVKNLGAKWDNKYKKWYINKNNKNIDIILQKWKRIL